MDRRNPPPGEGEHLARCLVPLLFPWVASPARNDSPTCGVSVTTACFRSEKRRFPDVSVRLVRIDDCRSLGQHRPRRRAGVRADAAQGAAEAGLVGVEADAVFPITSPACTAPEIATVEQIPQAQ